MVQWHVESRCGKGNMNRFRCWSSGPLPRLFRKILFYFKRLFRKVNSTHFSLLVSVRATPFRMFWILPPGVCLLEYPTCFHGREYNFEGLKRTVECIFSDQGPTLFCYNINISGLFLLNKSVDKKAIVDLLSHFKNYFP